LETSSIGPVVVVSELPFTVRPATFIQDLIHVKRAGMWPEIVDILDESDERGLRIVVQVRTGADPERLLAALLAGTSFETVLDGVAQQVSLPMLLRSSAQRLINRGATPATLIGELAALVSREGDARRTSVD